MHDLEYGHIVFIAGIINKDIFFSIGINCRCKKNTDLMVLITHFF